VRNPFGLEGHSWVGVVTVGTVLLLPLCNPRLGFEPGVALPTFRERGVRADKVASIRHFVGLVYLSSLLSKLVFAPESLVGNLPPPLWVEVQRNMLMLSYAGVPVAIGFAVLKYRLYDIDVIINRALVYGSLTFVLAVTYFGGVVGLQDLFRVLTGQGSTLAVVASTLAIAALFNPLRRRVQFIVDRRFYRSKYDARKTLESFSIKLRDETDLSSLSAELTSIVRETMQPAHVSLWLRPDTASKFEGSGEKS
jgi:hypothetical protein